MLINELIELGISNHRVLDAMRKVPREEFVPTAWRKHASENRPLPIGHDQTISQPLVVAEMLEQAKLRPEDRVLDVGTGSGYQAAILAELVQQVYSIEIIEPLFIDAQARLRRLGYANVTCRLGDGSQGWPEHAPYHAILVAAAPQEVPSALVDQLAVGGRLVIPIGEADHQHLAVIKKLSDGSTRLSTVAPVAFVPMTGKTKLES